MKTRVLLAAAVVAVLTCASPTWAEQGDSRVQFGLLYSTPTDDLKEPGETIELDDALGFEVSYEYLVSDLIGIEPVFSFANHEVAVKNAGVPEFDLGEIDFMALTANVNFHVLQEGDVDVYIGPTIGYILWGDLESSLFGDFGSDDEFTWGLNVGVDVPLGEGAWAFSGGLTYLAAEITLDGGVGMSSASDLGVDPILLRAGVSYTF